MGTFWLTKFTIGPGHGMGAYSLGHFFWLAAVVLTIVLLGRSYRNGDGKHRKRVLHILALLALLDELYKDIVPILTGQWNWAFLPLHICSISIFVIIIHAITGSAVAAEFLYAVSLPTAIMALVFPNWTSSLPFWNYESIHSFSIHGLIVIYPAILLYGGFRPCARRLLPVSAIFLALSGIASLANHFLGTNFFFLSGGDDGNPLSLLESYIGHWYILAFPVIAAICWIPMYRIPAIRKGKSAETG